METIRPLKIGCQETVKIGLRTPGQQSVSCNLLNSKLTQRYVWVDVRSQSIDGQLDSMGQATSKLTRCE